MTTGTQGPLADYAGGGSFAEWTPVLDAMLKLDFDTAVPGVPQIDPFYDELTKKKQGSRGGSLDPPSPHRR